MLPTDIDEMSIQECVGLLYAAKEEIAWLLNEISRLQCYIMVERQMQRAGETERSTVLRPLPRKRTKQTKQTGNGGEQIKEESPILESADSGWSAYNGRSASVELPGHF